MRPGPRPWAGRLAGVAVGLATGVPIGVAQAQAPLPTVALQALQTDLNGPAALRLQAPEGVLLLQPADLREQARQFGRIVFLIEKQGASRSRVMAPAEIAAWLRERGQALDTLTLGNNFATEELARFFNTALLQGEALSPPEQALLDDLLRWGVLLPGDGGRGWTTAAGWHTVLTVPRVSAPADCARCAVDAGLRQALLAHEFGHAEFGASLWVQHHARWFWFNQLSPIARSQWLRFLTQRGYDTGQLQIVLGELHAYLHHTDDEHLFKAADLDIGAGALAALRERYRAGLVRAQGGGN